jgi:UDP:flavonoid glycosyltransferase YjiC (YdhE family)
VKILIAATPVAGHLNPLIAIGRILAEAGHTVVVHTASMLRSHIEAASLDFLPFASGVDRSWDKIDQIFPERARLAPGPEQLVFDFQRIFVGQMAAQNASLREAVAEIQADLVVYDNLFFGALPLLLGSCAARPRMAACGITFLLSERPDRAPFGPGLPPAHTAAKRAQYAQIRAGADSALIQPIQAMFDRALSDLGLPPLTTPWTDAHVTLPDLYLQATVPGFEYPRDPWPANLRFIGKLPPPEHLAPLPGWWHEVDSSRRVVLVTQGTVANGDLGQLVGPTLQALAHERDVLVLVTTGGRSIEAIPGGLPANALAAPFLPFDLVLPRIDALVTNAGYGTVNQALALGIPLVAAGRTEDKPEISARIAWSGAGIDLATERPEPSALREAVRCLLDGDAHRQQARRLAEDFAGIDTRREILRLLVE